jgi:hypothetical protein
MSHGRLLAGGIAAGLALVAGTACNVMDLAGLGQMPSDLARAAADRKRQERPITYGESPGPVEAALYDHARKIEQPGLLIDTDDPADDLKLLARRCDGGEIPACARIADSFIDWLGAPEVGGLAEQQACEGGDAERCGRLGALPPPGESFRGGRGRPRQAWEHYLAACLAPQPVVRACRWAAAVVNGPGGALRAPHAAEIVGTGGPGTGLYPEYWACEDRACLLGDREACAWLRSLFAQGRIVAARIERTEPLREAAVRYYGALEAAPGAEASERSDDLRAAREVIEAELPPYFGPPSRCFTRAVSP